MSHNKSYLGYSTLFRTKCITSDNTQFLTTKWYDVIDFTNTQYLIRFKSSGGAKWYSKTRFRGYYKEVSY